MNGNLRYKTPKLSEYFSAHRQRWDEFYPSERWIFERVIAAGGFGHVLDVGCAAGGLGAALSERQALASYTGVDISDQAIAAARVRVPLSVPARFIAGDILDLSDLGRTAFDTVVSLSCADWNVETGRILERCWSLVAPRGRFVPSLGNPSPTARTPVGRVVFAVFAATKAREGESEASPHLDLRLLRDVWGPRLSAM